MLTRPQAAALVVALLVVPAASAAERLTLSASSAAVLSQDRITVTWSIPGPSYARPKEVSVEDQPLPRQTSGPWLGLFADGADLSRTLPLNVSEADGPNMGSAPYRWVNSIEREGSFTFVMDTNYRSDLQVVLLTGGFDLPIVLAARTLEITDKGLPGQVHLAYADTDGAALLVSWNSLYGATQTLEYATSAGNWQPHASQSAAVTYAASDMCGEPAAKQGWVDPGYTHRALTGPLEAGAAYAYRVGSDTHGWTETFTFVAPTPPSADASGTVRVFLLADQGEDFTEQGSHWHFQESSAQNTTSHMTLMAEAAHYDAVYHYGDLSYATGYLSLWDRFMTAIEPLAATTPYHTSQGNHEQDWGTSPSTASNITGCGGGECPPALWRGTDSGGECGVPTEARFQMPASSLVTQFEGWYVVRQGPVSFVVWNAELPWIPGSDQYAWLEQTLQAVDRKATPWVVMTTHRPLVSALAIDGDLEKIEPLLLEYKVDLSLYGHLHWAEVTCPMANGECVVDTDEDGWAAVTHMVTGNAGQKMAGPFPDPAGEYSKWSMTEHGFATLEASSTELLVQFWGDGPCDALPPLRHNVTMSRAYPRAAAP